MKQYVFTDVKRVANSYWHTGHDIMIRIEHFAWCHRIKVVYLPSFPSLLGDTLINARAGQVID